MQKRLEQARAQARAAALAAALAEAQQVICTASTDYIPYAHTHGHMHWPSQGSDIYREGTRPQLCCCGHTVYWLCNYLL